jgi:hypothetical protein
MDGFAIDLTVCMCHGYVQADAGTVAYMAPECFNPDIGGIGIKSDIFSLGVIIW